MKDILLPIAEFIINIIISVVVIGLTQKILNFDSTQGILIGSILFVALGVIQVNYRLSRQNKYFEMVESSNLTLDEINVEVKDINKFEHNINSLDEKTKRVSEGLRKIATDYSSENDLFIPWYHEKLDVLARHLAHTIESKSYYLDASIREQDRMNDVFQGRENDWFWATSSCDGITWYTTARGDIFVREMHRKFIAKQMAGIHRLFVYDRESDLTKFITQLCFLLHEQSGYEYKIISRQDFEAIFQGFGDRNLAGDFGIYGNHFVWETSVENKIFIDSGYVCVDDDKLKKYTRLFQRMWSHAIPYEISDEQLKTTYKDCHIDDLRTLYLSTISKTQSQ